MLSLAQMNILTVVAIGVVIFLEISYVRSTDTKGLTVVISPRHEECFFERMELANRTMSIYYSVIASKGGDYDVNFQVSDVIGRPMVTEFRKAISKVSLVIKDVGDYKICFDNTFSHFSTKTVAFEVTTDRKTSANWESYDPNALAPEETYEMTIQDIQNILKRVRVLINEVQGYQDSYRSIEARDRSLTESNFEYVNYCSCINMMLLVLVAIVQVLLMRSLFENMSFVQYMKKIAEKFTG